MTLTSTRSKFRRRCRSREFSCYTIPGLAGDAHARSADKPRYRWGRTKGRVGFHGGEVAVERPWVRSKSTGRDPPGLPEREALARRADGLALDRRRHG